MSDTEDEHQGILLLVDDEHNILKALRRLFIPLGYEVYTAGNGVEGLESLKENHVDVIISDMRMPEMDGATFLKHASEQYPDIKRILLTGYSDSESTLSAIKDADIDEFLDKPWMNRDLEKLVRKMLDGKHNPLQEKMDKHLAETGEA